MSGKRNSSIAHYFKKTLNLKISCKNCSETKMTNSKSKHCQSSIRPVGQRSITTTFPFRSSNQSIDCNTNLGSRKKGPNISLSDFLNRKLHKSPVLPKSVPGKEVAFSSPLASEDLNKVAVGETTHGKKEEEKTTLSLDGVFHLFKNVKHKDKDVEDSNSSDNAGSFGKKDLPQVGKRKNIFEGIVHKPSNVKRLAVLGEDLKPIHRSKMEHKPFNHYKSGGGWWDENMEGLDNEEVGCKDPWEEVGRTTLGAL